MPLASATAENAAANAVAALVAYSALHTATTGTTGASEVAGGTYARVATSWGAASGGTATNSNGLTINLPASTTAAYWGGWSAITTGTFEIGGALSPSVTTGTSAGTVTIAIGALSLAGS